MPSDEAFLAERRIADEKTFLIRSLDADRAPRIAPAVRAIRTLLADGEWHSWVSLAATGVRASDLAVRTVDNLIRRTVAAGVTEKRGESATTWRGRRSPDTRELRLIDWPEHEEMSK